MKKKLTASILAASALVTFSALPASAQASDGTITFNGSVVGSTCTISVNGGAKDATVSLQKVTTTALGAAGSVAGGTYFDIELSQCTGAATQVRAFFEAGPNVDSTTANLINRAANGAANVQVQLLSATGSALKIGDSSQRAAGTAVALTNNGATLKYGAQYYATNAATAGDVSTSVTYSIDYL